MNRRALQESAILFFKKDLDVFRETFRECKRHSAHATDYTGKPDNYMNSQLDKYKKDHFNKQKTPSMDAASYP